MGEVSPFRQRVRDLFTKLGIDYKNDKNNMFEIPNIKLSWRNLIKSTYSKSISTQENFVQTDEFAITSDLRIECLSPEGQVLAAQVRNERGKFVSYIRTDLFVDKKIAPSVKNIRKRTITDFNGIMKGNPHALVHSFV